MNVDRAIAGAAAAVLCAGLLAGCRTTANSTLERVNQALVDVPAPRGATMRAYVARPKGDGPHPAVVILHGTEGFTPMQTTLADDFAAAGFVAVAGCWFEGKHVPPDWPTPPSIACPRGPAFDGANQTTAENAEALLAFARGLPEVDKDRVGLWGQSRGGTIVLLLAARNAPARAVVAAAPIYAYPKRDGSYRDDFPIRHLDRLKVPVLMLQGTKDHIIPVAEAREFEAAARQAGVPLEAEYYDGMEHNLFYVGASRGAARDRAVAFFRKTLGD